jgi:hypothetical protein
MATPSIGRRITMTLADGCTSLHLAALRLCAAEIHMALRAGEDPNARDVLGRTPLCCALGRIDAGDVRFRKAWTAAVLLLLDAGADLDAPRYVGGKPLRALLPAWLRKRVNAFESERIAREFKAVLAAPKAMCAFDEGKARL